MKAQLVTLALLLGVGMTGMGTGAETAPQYIFVGETANGDIVTVPVDHPGSGEATCVINGYCTTGTHVRSGGLTHGFYTVPGNAGVLSSTIVGDDGNVRTFACVQNPTGFNCQGGGTFPGVGASIDHHCAGKTAPVDTVCRFVH